MKDNISNSSITLEENLKFSENRIYKKINLQISDLEINQEGKEYQACHYKLNTKLVHSRLAKITPKKNGQFVTFWKRNLEGITEPYREIDEFDILIVIVKSENKFGQFIFPKSVLIKHGIISTLKKEGKRGFRVYPTWDIAISKQAIKTQDWQLNYFFELNQTTDFTLAGTLVLNS